MEEMLWYLQVLPQTVIIQLYPESVVFGESVLGKPNYMPFSARCNVLILLTPTTSDEIELFFCETEDNSVCGVLFIGHREIR